jgi:hypothetical protein
MRFFVSRVSRPASSSSSKASFTHACRLPVVFSP